MSVVAKENVEKVRKYKPGEHVLPTDPIPAGWVRVRFDDGHYEAQPTAETVKGHPVRVDQTSVYQKAIFAAYEPFDAAHRRIDTKLPVRLLINKAGRNHIEHAQTWGDLSIPIIVGDDSQFEGPAWEPQFRFEF